MSMPDFVIAGPPRCGTTSLHHYLGQHPDIVMSATKEPNYFLFDGRDRHPLIAEPAIITKSVSDRSRYESLFATTDGLRGEASPLYFYVPRTPELIARELVDPAVVVVLRHPVDRAWSHFLYSYTGRSDAAERTFLDAVQDGADSDDIPYRTRTHLLRLGHYESQIDRYHEAVGADRLWIGFYDDLVEDAGSFVDSIVAFLGLEARPIETDVAHNAAMAPGNRVVQLSRAAVGHVQPMAKRVLPASATARLASIRTRRQHRRGPPEMSPELRGRLVDHFADTVDAVERVTGRDLSSWRR